MGALAVINDELDVGASEVASLGGCRVRDALQLPVFLRDRGHKNN
jgi:hypothetical protein